MNFIQNILKFFGIKKKLFSFNSKDNNKRLNYKTKVLEVNVGTYIDDGIGSNDYFIDFKVKRGKVHKKCIRAMKKNELTYKFNTLRLTPITDSAFVKVKKVRNGGNTEIYNVILIKQLKKWKKIKIN